MTEVEYQNAVDYIYGLKRFREEGDPLKRTKNLMERLGDPQEKMKVIHVTGTNGKGSTVAMIASILHETKYKVGMYISPHLSSFTERITVNKRHIPKQEVARLVAEIIPIVKEMEADGNVSKPTFFEVVTALMFTYFSEEHVDFAVLEVGLGGRLDATNVVDSLISIITNVHLEHTHVLGNTISSIAREKAGIINKEEIVLTGTEKKEALRKIKNKCHHQNATLYNFGEKIKIKEEERSLDFQTFTFSCEQNILYDLKTPLLGDYQLKNAALAVGAIKSLNHYGIKITENAIRSGLEKVKWPGRFEIVKKSPFIILDCAKDPAAARNLVKNIQNLIKAKKTYLVTSISSDKNISNMIKSFSCIADYFIVTEHSVRGRATDPCKMRNEIEKHEVPMEVVIPVRKAVQKAIAFADDSDLVLITGSVFTVREARKLWYKTVSF